MNPAKISAAALDVEWQRLQVIAQNLANMNSVNGPDGGVYRPQRLISGPKIAFAKTDREGAGAVMPTGVEVKGVETIEGGVRRRYEPKHPHSDAGGFISYPAVDHAAEMTLLIRTSRIYEANLTAINIARDMYARALDLGRPR